MRQPKGIYVLFLTEMWERFSFYGLRALLVLFMTQQFLFSDQKAYGIYGAYMALVYATPVLGGFIADKFLGLRRSIILGGILIALGHLCLALPMKGFFYYGLAFVICGTGFFKSCVSSIVGQLYEKNDPRRDAGFTIFYMGINIGAFLAAILCGYVAERFGWHYGFGLAGIGMVLGLITFLCGGRYLQGIGKPPSIERLKKRILPGISINTLLILFAFALVPLVKLLLQHDQFVGYILIVLSVFSIGAMLAIAFKGSKVERNRLLCLLVLMIFSVFFFALFEQAGSSMTLFAERNIDRLFMGWQIPTPFFQSLNPFFIIVLAPLVAMLWLQLGRKNREPSTPLKFSIGLFGAALGFGLLALGAMAVTESSNAHMLWLVGAYLFQTIGELCLSPVGLSAVTKLAPDRWVGMIMGVWFLSISFSNYIAAIIAKMSSVVGSSLKSAAVYGDVFSNVFYVGIAITVIALIMTPLLKRMMGGIN